MRRLYVLVAIAGAAAALLSAPLFYDTEVDEPVPVLSGQDITLGEFSDMEDEKRQEMVDRMSEDEKSMMMEMAASSPTTVSERMDGTFETVASGMFEGLYGHSAAGTAKIIRAGEQTYLRFEDFSVTNGPDLKVYLTPTGDVNDGVLLSDLKGSRGAQNYILDDENAMQAGYIVIYCQPFHVYFASAQME